MTNINENVSKAIAELVQSMMDRVMHRVLIEDPFIPEEHHNNKPVYAALVPDVIFRDSHFERRFVTPFGTFWEKWRSSLQRRTMVIAKKDGMLRELLGARAFEEFKKY